MWWILIGAILTLFAITTTAVPISMIDVELPSAICGFTAPSMIGIVLRYNSDSYGYSVIRESAKLSGNFSGVHSLLCFAVVETMGYPEKSRRWRWTPWVNNTRIEAEGPFALVSDKYRDGIFLINGSTSWYHIQNEFRTIGSVIKGPFPLYDVPGTDCYLDQPHGFTTVDLYCQTSKKRYRGQLVFDTQRPDPEALFAFAVEIPNSSLPFICCLLLMIVLLLCVFNAH
jgi:hypothetical protein